MDSNFKNESVSEVKDVRLFRIRSLRFRKSHQHRCWSLTILIITWSINALPNKRGRACEVNLKANPIYCDIVVQQGQSLLLNESSLGDFNATETFRYKATDHHQMQTQECWRTRSWWQSNCNACELSGRYYREYNIIMIENSSNSA